MTSRDYSAHSWIRVSCSESPVRANNRGSACWSRFETLVKKSWRSTARQSRFDAFLELPSAASQDATVRAAALNGSGSLAYNLGDFPAAAGSHEAALALRLSIGDEAAAAGSLNNLALVLRATGELERATGY